MVPFLLFLVLQVVIPALMVTALWRRKGWTRRDWLLSVAPGATYVMWVFLVTPWGTIPYPLRFVWPLLFTAAAAVGFVRLRREAADGTVPPKNRTSVFWALLPVLVLGAHVVNGLRGRVLPEPSIDLRFPLRDGTYLVHHAGSHPSINYHNAIATQRYALDVSALNPLGATAWGPAPKELNRYAVWGHTLYSPCDAVVHSAVDGLPDHIPPARDPKNPAGNHVELEAQGVRIFLAHMQKGSVRVKPGDRVKAGDPLGKVGNSGNTSEPHLHIHAVRGGKSLYDGEGVPLTFEGRFLVRNDLVFGARR